MFAEHYDPAEDDDEEQEKTYPKSDGQRKILAEAIKNILLFRSLDGVSILIYLNCIFDFDSTIRFMKP